MVSGRVRWVPDVAASFPGAGPSPLRWPLACPEGQTLEPGARLSPLAGNIRCEVIRATLLLSSQMAVCSKMQTGDNFLASNLRGLMQPEGLPEGRSAPGGRLIEAHNRLRRGSPRLPTTLPMMIMYG